MQWAKAKTIMIWMFLAVDLILAVVLISTNTSTDKTYRQNLLSVLKNNNLSVRSELLDTTFTDTFANEFKGLILTSKIAEKFIDSPVKIDEYTYENEEKTARLQASSGKIFYENSEPKFKGFSKVDKNNVDSKLKKYLKILGISKYVRLTGASEKDGDIYAEYSYFFRDKELFLSRINFVVSHSGIKKISGEINIPNENSGYDFTLSGIETILINFVQNNKFSETATVVSITPGYYCLKYENSVFSQAIPVYRIKTTDRIYIYDARDEIDATKRQITIDN